MAHTYHRRSNPHLHHSCAVEKYYFESGEEPGAWGTLLFRSGMITTGSPGFQGVVESRPFSKGRLWTTGCMGALTWGAEIVGSDESIRGWAEFD
jgi:hypothetical protein